MPVLRHAIPLLLAVLLAVPFAGPLAVPFAGPAAAGGGIEVAHPWARPTIPNRPGAVYLGVHNLGDAPDRLVGARAEGVGAVELHRSEEKDGVMTMTPVDSVEIPAGGMAHLGPGGLHLMLFDIEGRLEAGATLPLTLEFERAGDVAVDVPVSRDPPEQYQGGGHGHDGDGHDD